MKERSILFSGPMVRSILKGLKSQTRRVIKQKEINLAVSGHYYPSINKAQFIDSRGRDSMPISCPYGQPGDRLWVRETWWEDVDGKIWYRSDADEDGSIPYLVSATGQTQTGIGNRRVSKWKPSIYMPLRRAAGWPVSQEMGVYITANKVKSVSNFSARISIRLRAPSR